MNRFFLVLFAVVLIGLTGLASSPVYAGLFDDEEARKAISDLRGRLNALNDAKADKVVILEQMKQLDALREEVARLRGQVEVLANDVSDNQRRQKDFYTDLDNRLRKLEPQKVVVDGRESEVDAGEQKSYDAAVALFQSGDYARAATAFNVFVRNHKGSAYVPNALYSLGIAYYAQKEYKNAITTFQSLIKAYPDNPKAPDAMLNIASCYTEQKDNQSAKKILQNLRAQYPESAAAKTATERLNASKGV